MSYDVLAGDAHSLADRLNGAVVLGPVPAEGLPLGGLTVIAENPPPPGQETCTFSGAAGELRTVSEIVTELKAVFSAAIFETRRGPTGASWISVWNDEGFTIDKDGTANALLGLSTTADTVSTGPVDASRIHGFSASQGLGGYVVVLGDEEGPGPGAVASGDVVNESTVPGATVTAALNRLASIAYAPVATIAALSAVSNSIEGIVIRVQSVRDYWVSTNLSSPRALSAGAVAAHASGGNWRWERLCIPDPSWTGVTVWEINSGSSVENDGLTSGTAIPFHEFLRRRATAEGAFTIPTGVSMTINVNADMPTTDPLLLRPRIYGALVLNGVPTVAYAGTLSAKTDLSTAGTGTSPAATASWTVASVLNKPVKDLTNDRWSWIAKDNGAASARVNNWVAINETNGTNSTAASVLNTTVGASVEVYNLTIVHNATLEPQGAARLVVNKLAFPGTVNGMFKAPYQACFQNCDFAGVNRFGAGYYLMNNCRVNDQTIAATDQVFFLFSGGVVSTGFGNFAYHVGVTLDLCNYVLFQGTSVVIARGGVLRLRNVFFEDVANPIGFNALITVQTNAYVTCTSGTVVRGNGNTCNAMRMDSGTRCSIGLGASWTTVFSVATSAHNGICINGTAAGAPAGAKTTVRPTDPTTDLPFATPLSTTFANLQAAYGGGTGFGGFMKDTATDIWAGA